MMFANGDRTYTLSELVWISRVGFFRDDMRDEMKSLGISDDASFILRSSDAVRDRNIIQLWDDYGKEYGAEIVKLCEYYLESYLPGWPHAVKQ